MHWAKQYEFDFDLALNRARDHFDAEITEEGPTPSDACAMPDVSA